MSGFRSRLGRLRARDRMEMYIGTIRQERAFGRKKAKEFLRLPVESWGSIAADHPAWLRPGTMEALLHEAEKALLHHNPERALAITSFVLGHVHEVPVPAHGRIIADALPGEAWLLQGRAFLATGQWDAALAAAEEAERAFYPYPAMVIERADATLLHARVWTETGRLREALELMEECYEVYDDLRDLWGCIRALAAMGIAFSLMKSWDEAREAFAAAERLARRLRRPEASALLASAITRSSELGMPADGNARVITHPRSGPARKKR